MAALIFKVTAVTEVTSSLGSCPPACPLGLWPHALTVPLPTIQETPSKWEEGGLKFRVAPIDMGRARSQERPHPPLSSAPSQKGLQGLA